MNSTNDKYRLAISILIHEKPDFFEIQLLNIRKTHPAAIIVVHVSDYFWFSDHKKIKNICKKYKVTINEDHFITGWASPNIFSAIISNMLILEKIPNWTHYIFISSNELFYKNNIESLFISKFTLAQDAVVWQHEKNLFFDVSDKKYFKSWVNDKEFNSFLIDFNLDPIGGSDFGRLFNRSAFNLILEIINKYNFKRNNQFQYYSRSEIVIPSILNYLEINHKILIEKNIQFVFWYSEFESAKKSNSCIIIKHLPRIKHDKVVKEIMGDIGINYISTPLDLFISKFRNKFNVNNIINKQFYLIRNFQRKIENYFIKNKVK